MSDVSGNGTGYNHVFSVELCRDETLLYLGFTHLVKNIITNEIVGKFNNGTDASLFCEAKNDKLNS